ncbi:hypothetical protein EVAR_34105_1 [Eumeta japonica]|uniref:Uncharacterized protein n=1 Tax=Eumeta variegata TaxID=151549 RepID=A0A4C1WLY8_EUMVA|nr:hypothetical protein EVAR_34105_1 [Eumeta japonica]
MKTPNPRRVTNTLSASCEEIEKSDFILEQISRIKDMSYNTYCDRCNHGVSPYTSARAVARRRASAARPWRTNAPGESTHQTQLHDTNCCRELLRFCNLVYKHKVSDALSRPDVLYKAGHDIDERLLRDLRQATGAPTPPAGEAGGAQTPN